MDEFSGLTGQAQEEDSPNKDFLNEAIRPLRTKRPDPDVFASLTVDEQVSREEMDLRNFAALDAHIRFVYHEPFGSSAGYLGNDIRCHKKLTTVIRQS